MAHITLGPRPEVSHGGGGGGGGDYVKSTKELNHQLQWDSVPDYSAMYYTLLKYDGQNYNCLTRSIIVSGTEDHSLPETIGFPPKIQNERISMKRLNIRTIVLSAMIPTAAIAIFSVASAQAGDEHGQDRNPVDSSAEPPEGSLEKQLGLMDADGRQSSSPLEVGVVDARGRVIPVNTVTPAANVPPPFLEEGGHGNPNPKLKGETRFEEESRTVVRDPDGTRGEIVTVESRGWTRP